MSEEPREYPTRPFVGVGLVVFKADQVLLIKRGKPPITHEWSIPGGAQDLGETVREAALRELMEETAIEAEILGLIDVVDAVRHDDEGRVLFHYTLVDFAAEWRGGKPLAGDDVVEAHWIDLAKIDALGLWTETVRIIREAEKLR